jgi:RNA polymerase sigma factor (sigma-70 family)
MATNPTGPVIQYLRKAALLQNEGGMTDGQLLTCFIEHRDEAAFAALVKRHGPMVWGVCRRLLSHHDAEDAFQAVFLVLVRKAASIVPREKLANWLYGVAHQTALHSRRTTVRRRTRERQVTQMPEAALAEQDLRHDLQPLLDQALSRLPDKYRVAIVLCDLEGKTRKEAARQLGCPEGTLAARVARGRVLLAKRLARHGPSVSAGAVTAVLSQSAASASVPPSVVSLTNKAAMLVAAGQTTTTGVVSVKVAALTEGVLKNMLLSKLKTSMMLLGTLGVLVLGVGLATYDGFAQPAGNEAVKAQAQQPNTRKTGNDDQPKDSSKSDKEKLQGTWVKVGEEFGGKPVAKEDIRPMWLHFEEDKVTTYGIDLRTSKPEKSESTYALATDKNPKTIELTNGRRLDGPRTKPPDDVNGIYKIEGDTLMIAMGKRELPTKFTTTEGDGVVVAVFKREGAAKEKK